MSHACGRRTTERGANPCLMLTTSRRAWCAMSAGGSACGVVSSFGRRTCCVCVSARRNRTGKDAGAGKTTTASEKPCTALIVVSGAAVPGTREAGPCHSMPMHVNQSDAAARRVVLLPVRRCLQRVPLAPVVVCAAARALRPAGAAITTLPPLGYWRHRCAACSGAHASKQGTTNTELFGLAS